MHKQLRRTPLAAAIAVLVCLVVPAVAQAHHVNSKAECVLVGNQPTLRLTADFVQFSSTKDVAGKVYVDDGKVFDGKVPVDWTGDNGTWIYTQPATAGKSYKVVTTWSWPGGSDGETHYTSKCPTPPNPGISIVKDGPSTRYVGDQATFTYKVTNTGNVTLSDVTVTDDKCAPLTPVGNQGSFTPGAVRNYTCTLTITDAMGDQLVNVAKACGKYGDTQKCDEDDHKTDIPKPAILLDKTGAATAAAGSTFTYTFKATNIGTVTLTNVVLTDDKCQSTLTRSEPNLADQTFDKGDEWFYTCTVTAPAGPAQVDNVATVCGEFDAPDVDMKKVCDDDTHTFTVPPPGTPPTTPPTTPPGTTPVETPPSGSGVLPDTVVSGRAALRGPSGCVKQAFKARVRGRSIAAVTFFVDGRRVKRISGTRSVYSLKVRPGRFGFGRHKIVARVEFLEASGTPVRRLPLTFRRCAQGTVAPRFTG